MKVVLRRNESVYIEGNLRVGICVKEIHADHVQLELKIPSNTFISRTKRVDLSRMNAATHKE